MKKVLLGNHKSFIVTMALVLLFVFVMFLSQGKQIQLVEREVNADLLKSENGLEYLASFNDAELDLRDNSIFYTGNKPVSSFYEVEYLSDPNFSDYTLNFEITYIKELDILFMDVLLLDRFGETVEREKVFGYVVVDEAGNEDIEFDLYGFSFMGSELGIHEPVEKTAMNMLVHKALMELEDGGGGGGGVVYPILNVSYSIVGLDEAKDNAKKLVNPPNLLHDGPIKYIMHAAKMEMVKNDFKHNAALTRPTGFINDQNNSKWKNWKFGLSTIYDSGCGVIAMYNFLRDTGNNPDFATLIALTQLCNADLAYGIFGANPVPEEYLQLLALEAMIVFDLIIYPIAAALVPAVAAVIVANYIAEQPWWMQIILGLNYVAAVAATTAVIEAALFTAVVTANVFIANYFDDLHDIADVLGLFKLNNIYSTISYSSFNNHLSGYRYSIISFWNGVGSNGLIDFSQGAHTVYVKRYYQTNEFVDYNNGNSCLSPQSQFYKIITSNQSDVNKLFISGLVIKG